jgi:magnesium-transporting ATPase (P-type)
MDRLPFLDLTFRKVSRIEGGLLRMEFDRLSPNLLFRFLSPALYCNDSSLSNEQPEPPHPHSSSRAHPIDDSLILFGLSEFGWERMTRIRSNAPLEEIPFDSTKRFMATMHDLPLADLIDSTGIATVPADMIRGWYLCQPFPSSLLLSHLSSVILFCRWTGASHLSQRCT